MAKQTKQPQPKSFEEAIAELEKILGAMESGEVPLEESLVRYERGNYLIAYCRQVLGKAEEQIEQLTKTGEAPVAPATVPTGEGNDEDADAPF